MRHTPFGDALLEIVSEQMLRELLARETREVAFGAWQGVLQPYFPHWSNNLQLPEPEFRDGVYYFKVSLGEPWRRIAIPAKADLDKFAWSILRAFDFDGDHFYAFQLTARDGHSMCIEHPYSNAAEAYTDEITIGELPLSERQSMQFRYDYGADWQFDVRLEKIEPKGAKISKPTVVESRGKAPPENVLDNDW